MRGAHYTQGMSNNIRKQFGQYDTPVWVWEALLALHFPNLSSSDCVIDPGAGHGSALQAIPAQVPAMGVEICPIRARAARERSGRNVIVGDFRTVQIDVTPTAIIGNPLFAVALIEAYLDRSYAMLQRDGRVGFILPAWAFQTASRVVRYNERWSILAEHIPRNMFRGLSKPLTFAVFTKDEKRALVGFALYHLAAAIQNMDAGARETLEKGAGRGSVWRTVVKDALDRLGGSGSPEQVCEVLAGKRPTPNPEWKAQVRKVLRQHFQRVRRAYYTSQPANRCQEAA